TIWRYYQLSYSRRAVFAPILSFPRHASPVSLPFSFTSRFIAWVCFAARAYHVIKSTEGGHRPRAAKARERSQRQPRRDAIRCRWLMIVNKSAPGRVKPAWSAPTGNDICIYLRGFAANVLAPLSSTTHRRAGGRPPPCESRPAT